MPTCSARGCSVQSDITGKKNGITFHSFPLDPEKRKVWDSVVKRKSWASTKHSVLCSAHFEETCFVKSSKRVHLKENAVPSIFKKSRKRKTSGFSDSQHSSSTISDENTELNTLLGNPDIFTPLQILSHVCSLAQPMKDDILQEDAQTNEIQKLVSLMRHEIEMLKSKLAECEEKNKRYKKKIKNLEQRRWRKVNKRNAKELKIIDNLKLRNLLNDDLIEISKNMTNEHIELLKEEIRKSQASYSSTCSSCDIKPLVVPS